MSDYSPIRNALALLERDDVPEAQITLAVQHLRRYLAAEKQKLPKLPVMAGWRPTLTVVSGGLANA